MILSATSLKRLVGLHPDLVKFVHAACVECSKPEHNLDFMVMEGCRTVAQQRVNVAKGVSQTMKSRHIPQCNACGCGCAVDLVPMVGGKVSWAWPLYNKMAPIFKSAAASILVPIEWGGDWKSFKDGPHWQLPASYAPYAKKLPF